MKNIKNNVTKSKASLVGEGFHPCPNIKNKGITLIALVVTIIVLLILAGVSLSLVSRK